MKSPATIPALLASLVMAASSHAQWVTLVEHHFGGSSATNLHGAAANTFDSTKITGVTGNWVAATEFKADGSVTVGSGNLTSRSAYLDLGGYINAAKGTSAGLFRLTATYDVTIRWLSIGFSSLSAPATNNPFSHATVGGLGTMYAFTTTSGGALTLYTADVLGAGNGQRGDTGAYTNPLMLTIELDYRTWNGTTDFGKVTYFAGATQVHSFSFTSATGTMARSILISTNHTSASGDYDNIILQQVAAGTGTFADWIADFPGVGDQDGLDDDPDGDGIPNGVENYFGTDPGEFSPGLVADAVDTGTNTFTFTHPLNETPASDLTATYHWSTDLQTFHADGHPNGAGTTTVTFSQGAPSGGMVTVTATVTGSVIPDKLFVNVGVTQN